MSDVAFVFSNPRHHLEMMAPVADELSRRGVACSLISLAELRGFDTPRQSGARRVIPINLRRRAESSAERSETRAGRPTGDDTWRPGSLAKRLVWRLALAPRLRRLLRRARVVVVPNDAVYPYAELVDQLRDAGIPTILLQEGIRFQLPAQYTGRQYGASVTAAVCAWGEGSKEFFVAGQVPAERIVVTGAPRLDSLDLEAWRARGSELARTLALPTAPVDPTGPRLAGNAVPTPQNRPAPIAFMSNPIETQGYGTKDDKLALFARFLAGAAELLAARNIPVVVKNHLHEDPADYARVAAASPIPGLVSVAGADAPTFAVIAAARAVVVLTSTVGLEALTFGVPLGVLELPGHEPAFEYVARGAAVAIRASDVASGLAQLLEPDEARRAAGDAFVRRHLHDRGRARQNVADVIERSLGHSLGRRRGDSADDSRAHSRGPGLDHSRGPGLDHSRGRNLDPGRGPNLEPSPDPSHRRGPDPGPGSAAGPTARKETA